jgi:hypothetical protein
VRSTTWHDAARHGTHAWRLHASLASYVRCSITFGSVKLHDSLDLENRLRFTTDTAIVCEHFLFRCGMYDR